MLISFNRCFSTFDLIILRVLQLSIILLLLLIFKYFIILCLTSFMIILLYTRIINYLWRIHIVWILKVFIILIITFFLNALIIDLIVAKSMLDVILTLLFSVLWLLGLFTATTVVTHTNIIQIKLVAWRTSVFWINRWCSEILNSWWLSNCLKWTFSIRR